MQARADGEYYPEKTLDKTYKIPKKDPGEISAVVANTTASTGQSSAICQKSNQKATALASSYYNYPFDPKAASRLSSGYYQNFQYFPQYGNLPGQVAGYDYNSAVYSTQTQMYSTSTVAGTTSNACTQNSISNPMALATGAQTGSFNFSALPPPPPPPNESVDPIKQNIYKTLHAIKEKPKTYGRNIYDNESNNVQAVHGQAKPQAQVPGNQISNNKAYANPGYKSVGSGVQATTPYVANQSSAQQAVTKQGYGTQGVGNQGNQAYKNQAYNSQGHGTQAVGNQGAQANKNQAYNSQGYAGGKPGFNKQGQDGQGFGGNQGFKNQGFGNQGWKNQGYGNQGFNKQGGGNGNEGYTDQEYGNQGFKNQGYNKQGYGNDQGFGNQGFGNQGFGNQGYKNQDYGNQGGFKNQGYGGNQGYNKNQGFNKQGYGGNQGHNDQEYGNEGYNNQGFKNQRFNKPGFENQGPNRQGFKRFNDNSQNNQSYNNQSYTYPAYNNQGYNKNEYNRGYENHGYDDQNFNKPRYNNERFGNQNNKWQDRKKPVKKPAPEVPLEQTVPDLLDETLPKDLKMMFQPLFCKLCSAQLSSNQTAKMHYKSKNHEKKIRKWLTDYAETSGEPLHKRAVAVEKKEEVDAEKNPSWFHCEVCDLDLTGQMHAESHYMGKNHQKALLGYKTPAGGGYYDKDGKWVRVKGQKSKSFNFEKGEDNFGVDFKKPAETAGTEEVEETSSTGEPPAKKKKESVPAGEFHCQVCSVNTTCQDQLDTHFRGQKHAKKLKLLGLGHYAEQRAIIEEAAAVPTASSPPATEVPPADPELAVYRTPSGDYYCPVCNLTTNAEAQFVQHMGSKGHFKKAAATKPKPSA